MRWWPCVFQKIHTIHSPDGSTRTIKTVEKLKNGRRLSWPYLLTYVLQGVGSVKVLKIEEMLQIQEGGENVRFSTELEGDKIQGAANWYLAISQLRSQVIPGMRYLVRTRRLRLRLRTSIGGGLARTPWKLGRMIRSPTLLTSWPFSTPQRRLWNSWLWRPPPPSPSCCPSCWLQTCPAYWGPSSSCSSSPTPWRGPTGPCSLGWGRRG